MAEIAKTIDKQEYELNDFGSQRVKLHIGGRSVAEFVPNLNMRFDCHSTKEQFFINCNRVDGVKSAEPIQDAFEPVGGDKLRWLVRYDSDPRPTKKGNHIEEFALKFSDGVGFDKQPSTYQGFLDIEPYSNDPGPSVYGSYAVCQDVLWGRCIDNVVDRNVIHDAGCGKLCHIYSRRVYDSKGKEQWLEPIIDSIQANSARMVVEIPADFLDNAIFPVFVNDTFGYGQGASTTAFQITEIRSSGRGAPAGGDGTVDTIDIYASNTTASTDVKVGLFGDDGGGTPAPTTLIGGSGGENENLNVGDSAAKWFLFAADALSITNGTFYWPSISVSAATITAYYDAASGQRYYDTHTYADAWPTTHAKDSTSTAMYSFRCTYTPSAGGLSIPIAIHHLRQAGGL